MHKLFSKILISGVVISVFLFCSALNVIAADKEIKKEDAEGTETKEMKTEGPKKDSLMERIDFGNSYILGQSIKSGAVYLLHRKKSNIKSMLKTREDYREEILEEFKVNKADKIDDDS